MVVSKFKLAAHCSRLIEMVPLNNNKLLTYAVNSRKEVTKYVAALAEKGV